MTTHAIVVSAAVWIRTRCLLLRFAGLVFGCTSLLHAQTASTSMSGVPRLLILSGTAVDPHGKGIPGVTEVACAICKDQSGARLCGWKTQIVLADAKGHYNVQLGSSENDGLPVDRFSSNESRWLWGSSRWTRGVVARPAVRTEGRRCGNPEGASVFVLADPP
jgi:hypothetical protein